MSVMLPPMLVPSTVSFHIDSASRSGGQSITGNEQIVDSLASRWRATASFVIKGEAKTLAWRALVAGLRGRTGEILMGPHDFYRPVDANGRKLSVVAASSLGDCNSFLEDLSGFGQDQPTLATVAALGVLRATQITIDTGNIPLPRPGHYVGIGERLHLITAIWEATPGADVQARIWPPLREQVAAGTPLILDRPVCKMRLASDDSGQLTLERNFPATASLDFVEVI
jgi:hypothetical protein